RTRWVCRRSGSCRSSLAETRSWSKPGASFSTIHSISVLRPTGSSALGRPIRRLSPPARRRSVAAYAMRIIIRSSHMRAIDFHVHLPTPEWLDVTMAGYTEAAERYFRSPVSRRTLAEVAAEYEALDILAVLLAWDAEPGSHRPRRSNEY